MPPALFGTAPVVARATWVLGCGAAMGCGDCFGAAWALAFGEDVAGTETFGIGGADDVEELGAAAAGAISALGTVGAAWTCVWTWDCAGAGGASGSATKPLGAFTSGFAIAGLGTAGAAGAGAAGLLAATCGTRGFGAAVCAVD